MSEFTKRTITGYKPVPEDECTHVILTSDEYKAHLQRISEAEAETEAVKRKANTLVQEAKNYAKKVETEALESIELKKHELEEANERAEYWRSLNTNLLRIAKERANAGRNLNPKKAHTGYAIISSIEKEYRFRNNGEWDSDQLWETVMQSPYIVDFTAEQARQLIEEDLFPENEGGLLTRIGIDACYPGTYEKLISNWKERNTYTGHNALIKGQLRHKANLKDGYWEIVVIHTQPLTSFPADMRFVRKDAVTRDEVAKCRKENPTAENEEVAKCKKRIHKVKKKGPVSHTRVEI